MIKIENSKLNDIANFLDQAELSGRVSRHRTKLLGSIGEVMVDLAKDEKKIITDNGATIDEKGNIVGFPNDEAQLAAQKELADVKVEKSIFSERVEGQFSGLYHVLDNYDKALAGAEANAYDNLLEALEEGGYSEQND
jgi:hypothetical protein